MAQKVNRNGVVTLIAMRAGESESECELRGDDVAEVGQLKRLLEAVLKLELEVGGESIGER